MLSALISSRHGYPAMQLTPQPVHQRSVQFGPLVLKSGPLKLPTPITDRDRTVSRRSEPSSRATLIGEQPNPWDLLQPQDVTSRHRGAKPPRRCELLGEISLLSQRTFYPLSDGPSIQNHRSLYPSFDPARSVDLTVKHVYAIALHVRLPSVLNIPLKASDTLSEATTQSNYPPRTVSTFGGLDIR